MGNANSPASNVLGTIGTVLWCIQLVPQIWQNYRRKNCDGTPALMFFLWCACGVPQAIYLFSTPNSVPVRVQPILFTFFCLVTWVQTMYYPPIKYSLAKIALIAGTFVAVAVGLEAGLIVYFKRNFHDENNWRYTFFSVLTSVLLAIGLVPPYFELAKRQGRVVGISFLFLATDMAGAVFSLLSIVFGTMNVVTMVFYIVCAAMEAGIFVSHFVWCCRFKWGRKNAVIKDETNNTLDTDLERATVTEDANLDRATATEDADLEKTTENENVR